MVQQRPSLASVLCSSFGPLALAAALAACSAARTSSTVREQPLISHVEASGLSYEVRYEPGDVWNAARVAQAVERAGARLARWGDFKGPVLVRVHPSHEALERSLGLSGYPWLRAWAWGDQIALQSPGSWASDREVPESDLEELLTHELTHVLMYQLIETQEAPDLPPRPEPPLWFREGMASVTAGQGHRRWGPEELVRWVTVHPGVDLLRPAAEIYRTEKEAVYGAAHRAFELLLRTAGERGVRDILRHHGEGRSFEAAFALATGKPLEDFEADSIRVGFDSRIAGSATVASGAGGP